MNSDTKLVAGAGAAFLGIAVLYLSFLGAIVWLIATIIHGVFF